jgi:hypothetical protein
LGAKYHEANHGDLCQVLIDDFVTSSSRPSKTTQKY